MGPLLATLCKYFIGHNSTSDRSDQHCSTHDHFSETSVDSSKTLSGDLGGWYGSMVGCGNRVAPVAERNGQLVLFGLLLTNTIGTSLYVGRTPTVPTSR
jgi:hypothetical protein